MIDNRVKLVFLIPIIIIVAIGAYKSSVSDNKIKAYFLNFSKLKINEIVYIEIQELDSTTKKIDMKIEDTKDIRSLFLFIKDAEENEPSHPMIIKYFKISFHLKNNGQFSFYIANIKNNNGVIYIGHYSLRFSSKDLYKYLKESLKIEI